MLLVRSTCRSLSTLETSGDGRRYKDIFQCNFSHVTNSRLETFEDKRRPVTRARRDAIGGIAQLGER